MLSYQNQMQSLSYNSFRRRQREGEEGGLEKEEEDGDDDDAISCL